MKKLLSAGVVLGLLLTGCSKKESIIANNCDNEARKVSNAANAYVASPTKANCEAYKKTINDALKNCPNYYSGLSRQTLEDFNNTVCN